LNDVGSLMYEIKAPLSHRDFVNKEKIFFVPVLSSGSRKAGKPTGHAHEDFDVAIENKLSDRDVVKRRVGNLRTRTFKNDPANGVATENIRDRLQFFPCNQRLQA